MLLLFFSYWLLSLLCYRLAIFELSNKHKEDVKNLT